MTDPVFTWKDVPRATIGELNDAMYAIFKADDHAQAAEFMAAYRAFTEHADANIGYLTGYYDSATSLAMRRFFSAAHPVFGMESPTFEEAYDAGFLGAMGIDRG